MIRFNFAAQSGKRYVVTVICTADGSVDAYAATDASRGREIPLRVAPSKFHVVRQVVEGGAKAVGNLDEWTDEEFYGHFGACNQIGRRLAEESVWIAARGNPSVPQPLDGFLPPPRAPLSH